MDIKTFAKHVIVAVLAILLLGALVAFPIKWLWNYVTPTACGLNEITAWQGLALYALCQGLFVSQVKVKAKA